MDNSVWPWKPLRLVYNGALTFQDLARALLEADFPERGSIPKPEFMELAQRLGEDRFRRTADGRLHFKYLNCLVTYDEHGADAVSEVRP